MKRILIISPGPFSPTDNDGQTLEDMFQQWDKSKLAQFFIQDIGADFEFCDKYFRVNDSGALKYLLNKSYDPIPTRQYRKDKVNTIGGKSVPKNSLTLLLRNQLWKISPWKRSGVLEWIINYSPEVIFFEVGDNTYMIDFVIRLKKLLSIPLVVHNTEGFYFFKEPYFKHPSFAERFLYSHFHKKLVKSYSRLMQNTDYVFYSCEKLQKEFAEIYSVPSSVVYKTATFAKDRKTTKKEVSKISYVGNLSFNRPAALIEIADFLKESYSDLVIDVYGKIQSSDEEKAFKTHSNISYHGFIEYSAVEDVIASSDILLHVESKLSEREVAYGFSTKIPLSLASGACFFMYAPETVAGQDYIRTHIPLASAISNGEMRNKLGDILSDYEFRRQITLEELELAKKNHNKNTILTNFSNIISVL